MFVCACVWKVLLPTQRRPTSTHIQQRSTLPGAMRFSRLVFSVVNPQTLCKATNAFDLGYSAQRQVTVHYSCHCRETHSARNVNWKIHRLGVDTFPIGYEESRVQRDLPQLRAIGLRRGSSDSLAICILAGMHLPPRGYFAAQRTAWRIPRTLGRRNAVFLYPPFSSSIYASISLSYPPFSSSFSDSYLPFRLLDKRISRLSCIRIICREDDCQFPPDKEFRLVFNDIVQSMQMILSLTAYEFAVDERIM